MRNLIPSFISEHYLAGKFKGQFQATCMVVDVSGFSKMTDVLAQHGQHGAEVLAEVMQTVFDPMTESVYGRDGFIVGYAGDAFTAIFPQRVHSDSPTERAIAAALTIQKRLSAQFMHATPYGEFKISVKIGLGKGEIRWQIVQPPDGSNATFYFRGTAIARAVKAELNAKPGEVLVEPLLYQELRENLNGTFHEQGFFHVEDYTGTWPQFVQPHMEPLREDLVRVFWPEAILQLRQSGEFRPAVNVFIEVPSELQQKNGPELLLQKVLLLQKRYGGLLSRPDFGDKGFNLLLFWGAPVTQENDIERALNFVLDLQTEMNYPFKAGITYRTSYAGFMGGALREDYTCYGWGINLAARMMTSAAKGEILVDSEIARRAGRKFKFQPIGQKYFKGFAQPQMVFKFLGRKEKIEMAIFNGIFRGREQEIEKLSQFIAPIWDGKFAGILTIRGEAGIGKSRLVYEFQNAPVFMSKKVLWVICQTDEIIRQPLNPFRYWLKAYLGISDNKKDDAKNKHKFEQKIEEIIHSIEDTDLASNLDRGRSFLGALVNLYWTDSPYNQLDAQARYENTFLALSAFLRAESLRQPIIILIEDSHWLDEDSKAFLTYLSRTLAATYQQNYPIAILMTSRPEGEQLSFPNEILTETLTLLELSREALQHLAQDLLGGKISERLLQLLHERAEGNPFFAEQIIRYLQDEHLIQFEHDQWDIAWEQTSDSLPTDVRTVLIARLDRLKQDVKEVVQTASVLGREFEVRLLSHMLTDTQNLHENIRQAANADIWAIQDNDYCLFRHALMRDAAYNMQLRARQQALHRLAIRAFEHIYQDDLTPYYGQLAYHAENASLVEAARKYLTLAGKSAANAYQNAQAIDYFSRALLLTPPDHLQQRFELLLERAKVYYVLGERSAQAKDLERLEKLAHQLNDQAILDTLVMRAYYSFAVGDFSSTLDFSRRAAELADTLQNGEAALNAFTVWPLALLHLGKLDEAMEIAKKGLALAKRLNKRSKEGHIYNSMGLIAFERASHLSQVYFENALAIAQETQDHYLEARVLNNLGNIAAFLEGDYLAAKNYYKQAYNINRERGDRILTAGGLTNLGWISTILGDLREARGYYSQALELHKELNDPHYTLYALMNLSTLLLLQDEIDLALNYATEANNIARQTGDRSNEGWVLFYLGYIYLAQEKYEQANQAFQNAIRIREELNQPIYAIEALAGLIQVALKTDNLPLAWQGTEKILAFLKDKGNLQGAEEPLRIYLACYKVLERMQDSRAQWILQEAIKLLGNQISKISNEETRRQFIENIPWRRELYHLWENSRKQNK